MKNLFQKIPVELPKPPSHKKKRQSLLHTFEGGWYMKTFNENIPPLR